jgi:protein SCO1/2
MNRREYLERAGTLGVAGGLAGCLGFIGNSGSNSDVVLAKPERRFESSDIAYPAWGQQVPDVTVPSALDSGDVRVREVETPMLVTFFYSNCRTVCPTLIFTLRNVQAHAQDNGYSDAVSFFPITFDPARDTPERLRTYADEMNVAIEDDAWQFLRPSSRSRAKTVVEDQFGVAFQRTEPDDMDMYMFTHTSLTLLVNADGFVERAYNTDSPDEETIIEHLETVRTA